MGKKYLVQIARRLKKGGLICAVKGKNGGCRLSRPIDKISLGDVIRSVETVQGNYHCSGNHESCRNKRECALNEYWRSFETNLENILDNVKLSKWRALSDGTIVDTYDKPDPS